MYKRQALSGEKGFQPVVGQRRIFDKNLPDDADPVSYTHLVNMAINYGGREEIARAARLLAEQVKDGTLSPEEIGEKQVAAALYTAGQPELDLLIRPSGEKRISNFLLWQCAYAEFVFMDILWPVSYTHLTSAYSHSSACRVCHDARMVA